MEPLDIRVHRLNVGCGPHYAPAWWNIDVVESDEHDIHPDQVVSVDAPFEGFEGITALMLGHVLEHLPWERVVPFLVEARKTLVRDGQVCVVGPDVLRAIERWHRGKEPFAIVEACLEHAGSTSEFEPLRHHWNCHEQRAEWVLRDAGFHNVRPVPMSSRFLDSWPIVSRAQWQFAILADG